MRMFVGVDMRKGEAAALQPIDLRAGLGFNCIGIDSTGNHPPQEGAHCRLKGPRQHRYSIHQNHMTAHSHRRCSQSNLDCLFGGLFACHQCGAGQQARLMQLGNGPVDAICQTEVVGVDNETSHGVGASIKAAQSLDRPAWPENRNLELLDDRFAHSHSSSQLLRHLPSHWKLDIRPPHCGQTRLVMDEMIDPFDSPGSVSTVLIIVLLSRDPKTTRGTDLGHKRKCATRVITLSGAPNWLAAGTVSGPTACRLA